MIRQTAVTRVTQLNKLHESHELYATSCNQVTHLTCKYMYAESRLQHFPRFDAGGADPKGLDCPIDASPDRLQIREKSPLGDRGHVGANSTDAFWFATAQNEIALARAFATNCTESHMNIPLESKRCTV